MPFSIPQMHSGLTIIVFVFGQSFLISLTLELFETRARSFPKLYVTSGSSISCLIQMIVLSDNDYYSIASDYFGRPIVVTAYALCLVSVFNSHCDLVLFVFLDAINRSAVKEIW